MGLRKRVKKVLSIKTVTNLDAFPKAEEQCIQTSPIGGTVSILTIILILWLVKSEITSYWDSRFVFKFLPDTDFDAKLQFNIDLTVAMPCPAMGADIVDSTNQNLIQFGELEEEDTWFELDAEQRRQFDLMRNHNSYLREDYHAIQDTLWRSGKALRPFQSIPPRKKFHHVPYDACRIYGKLTLNKVSGNFHITAGKSLQLPHGHHVHIAAFMSDKDYNFSHRINHFSYGDPSPGIIHPLDGDEKITHENLMLYNYFIEVVPTVVDAFLTSYVTYQYSVKELERPINHMAGSHGVPGLFFKYDMSALKVHVKQERDSLPQFLVKLCASVGGIFVTSGLLASICNFVYDIITCKYLRKPTNIYSIPIGNHLVVDYEIKK